MQFTSLLQSENIPVPITVQSWLFTNQFFFVHLNHLVCILLLLAVAAKIHDDEGHLMSNNEAHVITFK